jgi:hypothetical protein
MHVFVSFSLVDGVFLGIDELHSLFNVGADLRPELIVSLIELSERFNIHKLGIWERRILFDQRQPILLDI